MVGEAFAGLSAFKTMFDMTKALKDIHDVTIRDRAIIDLQREILEAQAAQSELLHSVGQLKKGVAELKAWDSDKQRYELHELPPGVFVRSDYWSCRTPVPGASGGPAAADFAQSFYRPPLGNREIVQLLTPILQLRKK
jgi:hypothetical protein